MPNIEPPAAGLLRPAHRTVLTAGTVVWRVHSSHRAPHTPNPTAQPDELAGGRFDSLDGSYAYLYIADTPDGAIAETICRDLPLDPTIARIVPSSAVAGRTLTALTVTRSLTTAALHGPHLAAVGQDLWLTKCEARHYVTTRRWAHAIRAADPDLDGLAYRPRHNEDTLAWILTTDPAITPHPDLTVDPTTHTPTTRPRPRPRPRRPHHRRPQRHPLPHLSRSSENNLRQTTPTVMHWGDGLAAIVEYLYLTRYFKQLRPRRSSRLRVGLEHRAAGGSRSDGHRLRSESHHRCH
ncbi:MAG: RES family NAD+ phosphorylase [Rhodococcus sp. (in: high G+C Gram-positive bacteria)]|uniref:RES family NAD+ phosphorylase n=1 Tax=Rhodococcus sp. TaxID=1831 RepID=UPI003BAF6366